MCGVVDSAGVDCDLPYSGRRSCRVDHILTLEFFNIREVILLATDSLLMYIIDMIHHPSAVF